MSCTRLIISFALGIALIVGMGAAPRPAEAGGCKDLGLGKNCVVRRDIKKNAVNSRQVKNGSLTGADVKDGSLTGAEIQDAALTGADVEDGAIGKADLTPGIVAAGDILARTLLVSPVGDGADAAANGGELLTAITTLNAAQRDQPLGHQAGARHLRRGRDESRDAALRRA